VTKYPAEICPTTLSGTEKAKRKRECGDKTEIKDKGKNKNKAENKDEKNKIVLKLSDKKKIMWYSYRIECVRCQSKKAVKNGRAADGKQSHERRECGYRFSGGRTRTTALS
jgi:hypothetical protein